MFPWPLNRGGVQKVRRVRCWTSALPFMLIVATKTFARLCSNACSNPGHIRRHVAAPDGQEQGRSDPKRPRAARLEPSARISELVEALGIRTPGGLIVPSRTEYPFRQRV